MCSQCFTRELLLFCGNIKGGTWGKDDSVPSSSNIWHIPQNPVLKILTGKISRPNPFFLRYSRKEQDSHLKVTVLRTLLPYLTVHFWTETPTGTHMQSHFFNWSREYGAQNRDNPYSRTTVVFSSSTSTVGASETLCHQGKRTLADPRIGTAIAATLKLSQSWTRAASEEETFFAGIATGGKGRAGEEPGEVSRRREPGQRSLSSGRRNEGIRKARACLQQRL